MKMSGKTYNSKHTSEREKNNKRILYKTHILLVIWNVKNCTLILSIPCDRMYVVKIEIPSYCYRKRKVFLYCQRQYKWDNIFIKIMYIYISSNQFKEWSSVLPVECEWERRSQPGRWRHMEHALYWRRGSKRKPGGC